MLEITDPGFQDFREDASCLIRPQSLLGEKFVECEPTQPRAAGSEPPPELEEIADGEPGEGERFLPLEQNGKAVDLDLVNNIMREPYADRFRLILNDLGAGLAARGEELAEIVERSNPALRETDEVLAILARQNHQLAALASDGDAVLAPLARDRDRLTGFIDNAEVVGAATAERSAELEEGLAKLPPTLREVRLTMVELERLAEAGTPAFTQLGAAAPAATRATKALGPFADAATGALISLGDAAAASQAPLLASDPVIRSTRKLARSAAAPSKDLSKFLRDAAQDERLPQPAALRLSRRGRVQRLRLLRSLPARPAADHQLQRLRRRPAERLHRQLPAGLPDQRPGSRRDRRPRRDASASAGRRSAPRAARAAVRQAPRPSRERPSSRVTRPVRPSAPSREPPASPRFRREPTRPRPLRAPPPPRRGPEACGWTMRRRCSTS